MPPSNATAPWKPIWRSVAVASVIQAHGIARVAGSVERLYPQLSDDQQFTGDSRR